MNAFKNPEAAQANGVFLAGKKYMTLSVDERSLYAKQGVRDACHPYIPQYSNTLPG